jgi:hypothetical protein
MTRKSKKTQVRATEWQISHPDCVTIVVRLDEGAVSFDADLAFEQIPAVIELLEQIVENGRPNHEVADE